MCVCVCIYIPSWHSCTEADAWHSQMKFLWIAKWSPNLCAIFAFDSCCFCCRLECIALRLPAPFSPIYSDLATALAYNNNENQGICSERCGQGHVTCILAGQLSNWATEAAWWIYIMFIVLNWKSHTPSLTSSQLLYHKKKKKQQNFIILKDTCTFTLLFSAFRASTLFPPRHLFPPFFHLLCCFCLLGCHWQDIFG